MIKQAMSTFCRELFCNQKRHDGSKEESVEIKFKQV